MAIPNILFVTAELTPIAKVGGLADVADALPKALKHTGKAHARIVLPYYDVVRATNPRTTVVLGDLPVRVGGKTEHIRVLRADIGENDVYLLEHAERFGTDGVYLQHTTPSDPFAEMGRFIFFSQAVAQLIGVLPDFHPDILHCHDWHTGLVPALVRHMYGPKSPATVFTIHNLAMQGRWHRKDILHMLDLTVDDVPTFSAVDSNGDLSIIEQGILASDVVNTVSRTYAKEILTPEYGAGMEGSLKKRQEDLFGIVNGIDVERFDPSTDAALMAPYTIKTVGEKKRSNKEALQKETKLTVRSDAPLFGFVGRLTDQKGVDLLVEAARGILAEKNMQLMILGTGDPTIEEQVRRLVNEYPENAATVIGFDAALADRIYAGTDFFVMPSKFEPCGLGQLIALRYGSIPVVRKTGGLADTVQDYTADPANGVGFQFTDFSSAALAGAMRRAMGVFQNTEVYAGLVRRAMRQDVSWNASAPEYATLYARALAHHEG